MSALVKVLFPLPAYRRTPVSLLGWWEQRRPVYNLIVGGTGLFTLGLVQAISWLPPGLGNFQIPWQLVLAYGVIANACYSFGWLAEVAMRKLWGDDAPVVGPALFRQGLVFSVGLTLFPVGIASVGWLLHLATVVRGLF